MKKMFSHLDKITAGEEEALEPYEQIDPRVMETSAVDDENDDSAELPSLFNQMILVSHTSTLQSNLCNKFKGYSWER